MQSYLYDVARAFRKNFYGGYLHDPRGRVRLLKTHFDVEAMFYYYRIGSAIDTPANRAEEDLDGDTFRTIEDAKLLIKRELRNQRPLYMFGSRRLIGSKVERRKWSEGWTTAKFFTIGNSTYVFLLKKTGFDHEGNNVTIHEMNRDGKVGRKVESHRWTEGWTTAEFYNIGGSTHLFLLKERGSVDGKNVTIHEMNPDGRLGRKLKSYSWSEGWTTASSYAIGGTTFLFLLRKSGVGRDGKNVHSIEMRSDGTVSSIQSHRWSEGWTTAEFFTIDETPYLFLLKETGVVDGKNVTIHEMNGDGTLGRKVESYRWTEGWTTASFCTFRGTTLLFLLKERGASHDGKNVHIHTMNRDGTVGNEVETHGWTEGWTTAEFYTIGNRTYLFLLKETGVGADGKNVHIRRMKGGGHAVAVDGFKEDDDGTFSICVKWGDPSPNNSDPNRPSDPPWFELEKPIGDETRDPLDGAERKFISIQPSG